MHLSNLCICCYIRTTQPNTLSYCSKHSNNVWDILHMSVFHTLQRAYCTLLWHLYMHMGDKYYSINYCVCRDVCYWATWRMTREWTHFW